VAVAYSQAVLTGGGSVRDRRVALPLHVVTDQSSLSSFSNSVFLA
jgi:hypothetical protein